MLIANKSTEDLITFIEDREAGKRSQSSLATNATVSKISQYKKNKNKSPEDRPGDNKYANSGVICTYCGGKGHGSSAPKDIRQQMCPAYTTSCEKCHKPGHFTEMCRYKNPKVNAIQSQAEFIGSIQVANIESPNKSLKISHKEYTELSGWTVTKKNKHPLITVTIDVSVDDYKSFNLDPPRRQLKSVNRIAIADTGAMTVVAVIA